MLSRLKPILDNKKYFLILALAAAAFFLTNIWVNVYVGILDFLNFRYRPVITEIIYQNPQANPEPYEMPLYIGITVCFIVVIWLYYLFVQKKVSSANATFTSNPLFKMCVVIFFIFFAFAFINKIGPYPLQNELGFFLSHGYLYPYQPISQDIYLIVYLLFVGFAGLVVMFSKLLQQMIKNNSLKMFLYCVLVCFIVLFITFDARFAHAMLDASFFYGPAWEVSAGKTLFTHVPSQYGFFSILFFSFFYTLSNISFAYFPVFIWLLYAFEYLICFYVVLKTSKSPPLSFICLFSLITANYFSLYHNPQGGPLRWIPLFLAVLLVYKLKKIDSILLLFSICLLSFWNIDSGIALIFGYAMTIGISFLARQITFIKACILGIYFTAGVFLIALSANLVHIALSYEPIQYSALFQTLKKNAATGFIMVPIEYSTYFWLVILIYIASILFFFKSMAAKKKYDQSLMVLLFSANVMLSASLYYVGRSMPHNLFLISPFFILTSFLLISKLALYIDSSREKLVVLIASFLLFIAIPGYFRREYLTGEVLYKINQLSKGNVFASEIDSLVNERYKKDVAMIEKHITEKEVVLISTDDTYMFYLMDKKNMIDANPAFGIDMKSEMDKALGRVKKNCPKKIAVDCQIYNRCPAYKSFTRGWPNILPIILNDIETACKSRYKPVECGRYMCVVEKT